VLAVGILYGALLLLAPPVQSLGQLYGGSLSLELPSLSRVVALMSAGPVLGWLGSWLSVSRHLKKIQQLLRANAPIVAAVDELRQCFAIIGHLKRGQHRFPFAHSQQRDPRAGTAAAEGHAVYRRQIVRGQLRR